MPVMSEQGPTLQAGRQATCLRFEYILHDAGVNFTHAPLSEFATLSFFPAVASYKKYKITFWDTVRFAVIRLI